ncbi:MAG: zinc-ribbon domain-containing protein [Syntrophobacterales bacterium]|nr:zinc-ribbon domain-containing protein [Syntrophobacterales bacterium]
MIIQCQKCSTKFRFDDKLMDKEGVWVRCGHCKHEFFQKNPFLKDGNMPKQPHDSPKTSKKSAEHELNKSASPDTSDEFDEEISPEDAARAKKTARSGSGKLRIFLKIFLLFILTCLFAAACLWSYMQVSGMKVRDFASVVPYLDKIIAAEDTSVLKLTQIKVAHLKQRYVKNWILGDVLVVEGTAWNSASFPVARIRIVATLHDANDMELARKEAFAGNILTPVELATLPEEAMARELSLSQGRDVTNDRIESHGNIPFMIVFTKSYPGAVKTKVYVAGAEKLLTN